jgi:hypothetical protein
MCSDDKKINHKDIGQAKEKIAPKFLNEEKTKYIDEDGCIVIGEISDEMRSVLSGINLTLESAFNSKNN